MILIPEQVKALRDEIKRLEEQKKDYKEYFKNRDKTTMDLGFVKYVDTTLETDSYNDIYNKLDSYRRALTENEFIDPEESNTIDCGTEFTVLYDGTEEEKTYTLVESLIGLSRYGLDKNKTYIPVDSNLGATVLGKSTDDDFSYTVCLKGREDVITISGKIVNILRKSNQDIHFIMSKQKARRISQKNAIAIKKAHQEENIEAVGKLNEITLSQYDLLKEEQERLSNILSKLKRQKYKIMVGSIITLETKDGEISKYIIVEKDDVDFSSEIDADSEIAKKLFVKKKWDRIDEKVTYKINRKKIIKHYVGRIVSVDNSMIEQKEYFKSNIQSISTRLGIVNKLLSEAKIAQPPVDNTVGIGSKVSIVTFENGNIQNRRVEVINHAVSTELNTDYVEAISWLGEQIMGLQENQCFNYGYFSTLYNKVSKSDGTVYDINNNMQEPLAKDPLAYQKKRRG